ncbi:hypothetical protein GWI33_005752 [Rhynchophorus ferrugineus]|uniref:dolichyl-phosphate-mannose--protein mannosyltransferase n=1 Tax=Rhynchophorus ferrugineus TaxID=354439 RepID=A0A834IIM7_RHYFE|nr:hypothetical protein GWI33_005752 [Rhynchophorus ferrugineus]
MDNNNNAGKFIAIASVAWASHFVSLWGGFVFDDSEAIVKNKDILPYTPIKSVFENDFWGTNIALNNSHKSYRPLTILSFRLNMFFSNNRLDAFQFHTANVVLHGILSIMTLPFFECLLKRRKQRKSLLPLDDPAFTGALLFAAHPIHCESVAALVGRADLLGTIFFMLLIIMYKSQNNFSWLLLVFGITSAAVLCKETAITVLGMCFIYEVYLRKTSSKGWMDILTYKLATRLGLLLLTGIVIMYLRLKIMNFEGPTFSPTDNPAAFSDIIVTKILTYNYIYFLNVLLLIWPQWLCFDWSMGCIPLLESFLDLRVLIVLIFLSAITLIIYRVLKNCISLNKIDVSAIGLCLTILPFIPASNILFRVGFVIAERNLLLSSAGFCLLVAVGLEKLKSRYERYKSILSALYVLLVISFIARCILRNYEWLNEERLFKSALKVCPLNAKVHYNIAKVEADQGNKQSAIKNYRHALELYPSYEQAMNNLANILRDEGNLDEAEVLLKKAVEVRPNFAAAWMNLGIVLSGKGLSLEAEKAYKTALKYRTKYADAHYNLGNLLLDLGRHEEALASWKEATKVRPIHSAAWGNALALLDSSGRPAEAVELGQKALRYVPRAAPIHFALGNAFGKLHRFVEAEAHFLQAIKLNVNNALYYSNLGVLYHRWEKPNEAREMYLKALKVDPNLKSAQINLKKLESSLVTSNAHSNKSDI